MKQFIELSTDDGKETYTFRLDEIVAFSWRLETLWVYLRTLDSPILIPDGEGLNMDLLTTAFMGDE